MYRRTNLSVLLVVFALFVAFGTCEITAGKIIYVDEIAGGANDGSSWDDAYNFLQDALADANESEKPVEIRLAQGSYSPDQDTLNPEGTAERRATFHLINGVSLKGGYAGLGSADPNARDSVLFETALVGEIRQTGFGGGNSYHIVTGSGTDETAVLDGLIIAGGNANGPRLGQESDYDYRFRYGGGLYNDAGSPTVIDCVFTDNSAYIGGGAIYNSNGGSPTLTDCMFEWNSAVDGCGIYNSNSNPSLTGCVFSMNIAQNNGGGMYNEQSSPVLTDCVFIDNSGSFGGGIYNSRSNPTLTDCSFIANTTLTIRSFDNTLSCGGGMYNDRSSPILSNCIFSENSAYASLSNFGGAMYNNDNSNPVLTGCSFEANWSENYGGGLYNSESSPTLTDCIFNGNWAEQYGGGMYNKQSNPTLTGCWFVWNWAAVITSYHDSYPSGAGMYNEAGSPILSACVISGNYSEGDGAGMYNSDSSPELDNCIIAGNWTADFGGGIYSEAGNPTLTNCTFYGNIAYEGNALFCDSTREQSPGNIEMTNCILWDGGGEIWNNDDSVITISYSNIRGGFPGRGNIDTDPLFAEAGYWVNFYDPNIIVEPDDPNASWTDGDYHLQSQAGRWDPNSESWMIDDITSPCIDAGDPNSPAAFEPSPNGGIINIGAFGGTTEASKSPSGLNAKYGGGIGEPNDPYLIYTAEHLNALGAEPDDYDKHFMLMADIDLSEYDGKDGRETFNLIGSYVVGYNENGSRIYGIPFSGVFNGQGNKIYRFTFFRHLKFEPGGIVGLFHSVRGTITDLHLVDAEVNNSVNGAGILVGKLLNGGIINNCSVERGHVSGPACVGGLVAANYNPPVKFIKRADGGIISNCWVTQTTVSGASEAGGLVGSNEGIVTYCYAHSDVHGDDTIGGLTGSNFGSISFCYSTGTVNGGLYVGGLVGSQYSNGTITMCYSSASVTGNGDIGGLIGEKYGDSNSITASFWDIETSGQTSSAAGMGLTTAQMQVASTFLEAGWDFVDETENGTDDIWWILEGQDYPRLAWELTE